MSIGLVSHTIVQSSGGATVTTGSINTTGANLLVAYVSDYNGGGGVTFSDNKSNTWLLVPSSSPPSVGQVRGQMYYAKNATVGSGHTVTATGTNIYSTVAVAAFSGADTTAPLDQQNQGQSASAASLNAGSVTPSADNELVITGFGDDTADGGIFLSPLSILDSASFNGGNAEGGALGYEIQTTATTRNPFWQTNVDSNLVAIVATFKVSGGGGGGGQLFRTPLLNGLGSGGPFFSNPLGRHRQPGNPQPWAKVNGIYRKAA